MSYSKIDFYDMSLDEIEKHLNIMHISKHNTSDHNQTVILDNWSQVASYIRTLRQNVTHYSFTSILGYKLVHDNHYIKLYLKYNVSNA